MKILALSGFVPEQICDVIRFRGYKEKTEISHYCGYAAEFLARVSNDAGIDGAVFPRSCDSSRIIKSYLNAAEKFVFQLEVPTVRSEEAVGYFAEELLRYRRAVEEFYGVELNDLEARIALSEERNRRLRVAYEQLESHSYKEYLSTIHRLLEQPLCMQTVPDFSVTPQGRKRIFLVSSFLANTGILDILEERELRIVGDDLPESGRAIHAPAVQESSLRGIARSILYTKPSPSRNMFKEVVEEDLAEITRKQVDGVVFVSQKYCEPYDFLYAVYRKALDERGIPSVRIGLSGSESNSNAEAALDAFADMLG